MTAYSILQGIIAEKKAARYLFTQGLRLVKKNYRCQYGEIDLIMQEATTLVFIEVRLRNNTINGDAICSITPQKVQRISKTALHFLQKHPQYQNFNARFDAVGLYQQEIHWIRAAFDVEYDF